MGVMDTSVPFLGDSDGQPKRYPLNDYYRTPNMKRLAAQGIRLSDFYAMSVCSPTRISIMTGQNSARHRTTTWISPEKNNGGKLGPPDWSWRGVTPNTVTLSRTLQAAGYHTIHVGKGHFGPFQSEGADPLNFGFDVNVGGRSIGAPGSYSGLENYENKNKRDRAVPHLEKYHGTDTHLTDALTAEALMHVTAATQNGKPFFLYLSHYAVHSPHQSDPRFAANYLASDKPERAQNFATLVEGMDKSLGDVMDRVNQLGIGEETLILFLGDNGSDAPLGHQHAVACAAPLRGKKGSHYEGGVRVPFMAAWAKPNGDHRLQKKWAIPAGKLQSQMANVCDLFPTICELTSAESPNGHEFDGRSLKRLFSGKSDPEHSQKFLMHFPHEHRSSYYTTLRDQNWKVAYQYHKLGDANGARYQLFDLETDPFEQTNLAKVKPKKLREMMLELQDELERHQALYPSGSETSYQPLRPTLPQTSTR